MRFFFLQAEIKPSLSFFLWLLFGLVFLRCSDTMNCVLTLWMWWLWWATQPYRLRFCRVFGLLGVFRGGCLKSCAGVLRSAV